MSARQHLSLDGPWSFDTDPRGVGLTERWFERPRFERSVSVPGPWQLAARDLVGYTGVAWYSREFEVPADWAGREVALHFDAVDYEARVWVDGRYLGSHEGGYTPFEFVLGAVGTPGVHTVVLRAYDPADNSEIPHGKQGSWYTRVSGPWQPVTLEARDAVHVKGLWITPEPQEQQATVRVEAAAADGTTCIVRLLDPEGAEVARSEGVLSDGTLSLTLPVPSPRLWTPEDPARYTALATVGDDTREARFGMRWVSYEAGLVHLNGQPLYIRGALDQAFYPETVYRVPSTEAIETEIRLAKQMGLNLLRKHIKLEDPRYLDACDRLGMLIWEEPACYYKYSPEAKKRFTREIEAMVRRDYNHPSIIAWSLYNEEWGLEWRLWKDTEKQAHVEELYHHAKGLDGTRLICDNSGWAHVKTDINDWHRYFVTPDLDHEWLVDLSHCLERPDANFVAGKGENAKGVPVIISEFGVWGLPEPSRITAWYGEKPWWFEAQWPGHTEEFKYPATALRNFERFGLDTVFPGGLDTLAHLCQLRMMRALKSIIEAMRRRADLAGYVVTEFTDIEWESNGWLDYFRQPKAGFELFPVFNGALVVLAGPLRHNLWEGEALTVPVTISNHTDAEFKGVVRWAVEGHPSLKGELPVTVAPRGNSDAGSFVLTAPAVTGSVAARLTLTLERDGRAVASNAEELTLTSRRLAEASGLGPVTLHGDLFHLEAAFAAAKIPMVSEASRDTLMLTTTLDATVRAHLEAGGRALFIAEGGDAAADKGFVSFRRLPRGESWDRAASIMFARPELFPDLPIGRIFGWELEDLYPHHVVPLSNYLHDFGGRGIELVSNQAEMDPAGVLAGYFEGWIGKFAATIARLPHGEGALTITTLRVLEHYGRPIATAMLHRLLAIAAQPLRPEALTTSTKGRPE